jgi:allantoin racemase
MSEKPLKVMYFSPVAGGIEHDEIFADMARQHKLPCTEVHIASLPKSEGGFTHIEYRSYEAMVSRGIIRAVRAAAARVSMPLSSAAFTIPRCTTPVRSRKA